jgi:hypothetical protein
MSERCEPAHASIAPAFQAPSQPAPACAPHLADLDVARRARPEEADGEPPEPDELALALDGLLVRERPLSLGQPGEEGEGDEEDEGGLGARERLEIHHLRVAARESRHEDEDLDRPDEEEVEARAVRHDVEDGVGVVDDPARERARAVRDVAPRDCRDRRFRRHGDGGKGKGARTAKCEERRVASRAGGGERLALEWSGEARARPIASGKGARAGASDGTQGGQATGHSVVRRRCAGATCTALEVRRVARGATCETRRRASRSERSRTRGSRSTAKAHEAARGRVLREW